jgi:hypothetical protein
MHRVVVAGHIPDLLEDGEHLAVMADDVAEPRHVAGAQLQADEVGHIPEGGQDAGGATGAVVHAGNRHLDAAGFPGLGDDGERIIGGFGRIRRGFGEGAPPPAEGCAEDLVAIPAQHLLSAVAGDALRLPVEEKDAALQVVGDDPFFQVVQDMLQVVPVAHQGFKGKLSHAACYRI